MKTLDDVLEVKTLLRKMILTTPSGPGVTPDYRPDVAVIRPYLRLRSLMANLETKSNLVEGPVEASQTGTVDYQTTEGVAKSLIDFTYTLGKFPVATIATWVAASRQVVDDSAAFSGYLDTRVTDLVEQRVEKELLYGDGATGHITGLTVNATAGGAGTTTLDKIAGALTTLATAGIIPDGIVLNPVDFLAIVSSKNGTGAYPAGMPLDVSLPQALWGFPMTFSNQMLAGHYLVGGFAYAAIFNRQNATVEVSRNHDLNFIKNLVAIRAEERLALAIYKPTAFVYGAT